LELCNLGNSSKGFGYFSFLRFMQGC